MSYAALIAAWTAVGVANAGFAYACLQRKYPTVAEANRAEDIAFACLVIGSGPLGILPSIVSGLYGYGWLFPGVKP
ncbi:hypothetical protein EN866_34255 [Mesorhizobium sp. M2D.F.Ca.ET.223.01.1.1]|uniref:hypothetical protein n=1 Tax=Mesorhizobium sp. M2D.F.Ca.ET.223.01.1.1 TaxID=2563940 RepID=UPI0010920662|nr:hypothetical protein [Mesorhizobium sp. M2D.F.Ca.ET.223.01.1.1]TGR83314.1 hypothetical protein EN866_34255 [Mesorhizobium sp. M2D.F.Ca.ET.223.01.1.1]TGT65290.1 hypothetical protein EN802_31920 [bacterium M00.F.Ca.ET.159.01.1.1]TGT79401.1 hypothetical protein EN800_31260 [bacterium M00.F.Ca.ET.157.01.1.1]